MRTQILSQFRDNLNILLMDMEGEDFNADQHAISGLVDLWAKFKSLWRCLAIHHW